ncbi:hypothetical protein A1F97_06428 [Pyrenophora tritici-repentis]|uniref:Tetratricopeptide repeat family protein n=2 Tax=Pyrenophora tritici-repentis TaxID=45151 RepID=A0A2W1GZA0_9PLEO|nr:tetratricopeptide repeat family protein [Pyrenophora tritici-repentis Pt-1C-BFP]KAF7451343.1 hypothetical protein A1F99_031200 [Pyrenophora tritici-repentis]EDU44276.1 tetratricopeptide repeat family protein [Pyrenophora tritici-repentis Pt-1C-BFP]KAF7575551.1 tetratricopeptide repeat family protein [Pyrenophora tritici-repentis]PZC93951.1 hypothetical protein A1F95_06936 [Pyrenophora tritici-repentis]PZD28570.1 hypothetical protein A1F96_05805 [Pyrenophora tritici-repentis]
MSQNVDSVFAEAVAYQSALECQDEDIKIIKGNRAVAGLVDSRRANFHPLVSFNLRLLALDGGGVRGLSALMILEQRRCTNEALQRYEEALGSEDILTLETMGCLGMIYVNQGMLTEAECTIKRAAEGLSEMLAPKSAPVLRVGGILSMLYNKQGNLGDAEYSFKQVSQRMEETLGPKHVSTLLASNNLGILYKN